VSEKRPVHAPSNSWWVIAAALSPLCDSINITLTTIQARDLIISQRRQEASELFANICAGIRIHTRIVDSLDGVDLLTVVSNDRWWITKNDILEHIKDQGSWVRELFIELPDPEKSQVLHEIGEFALSIVAEGSKVQAERNSNNNASAFEAPPVMPDELRKLRTGAFINDVVDPYRQHVMKFWTADDIDKVENEHKELLVAYLCEPGVKAAFDAHNEIPGYISLM
jgi:hypothetical protein